MATRKTGSSSTSPPQPELSPLVSKEMQPGWLESRLVLVISVGLVFSLQKFIEVRTVLRVPGFVEIKNDGWTKLALGNIVTLLLFVLLVAFASAAVPRRDRAGVEAPTLGRTTDRSLGWYRFGVFLVAGVFLFGNMQSRLLAGYIQAVSASPPLGVAVAWLAVWAVFAAAALWAKPTSPVDVAGFVVLILLTRTYAYWYHQFAEIHGDMMATIDRSQDLLLRGQFPYIDTPGPAMPYWPGTFLLYTPPKLLGWDYRTMNLIVEVATILVAGWVGADGRINPSRWAVARTALPLLMLFPSWTFYSAETQYPVSTLLAVVFCRSLTSLGGTVQAVTLGVAVAVNQTFGVLGILILPFWIRQFGLGKAIRLTFASFFTCFLIISPFLLWNAKEFVRVTLLSLHAFSTDQLAGRFSLRPLVEGVFPHATEVLLATTIAFVMATNYSRRTNETRAATAVALGYCLFLFCLHRTFSHYYLPVVAMILSIPPEGRSAPGKTPDTGSACSASQ